MYFTYVVRPGDAPEGRGPQFKPFWDRCMDFNLRGGFLLQFFGYLLISVSSLLGGNVLQNFGILNGDTHALRNVPIIIALCGALLCTIGAVSVQNFRNIADDDASINQTRGFRAGIKALHQASLLDILSWAMTTVLLFSFMKYFEDEFAAKTVGSGSTAIYASMARTLHSLSCILYAMAFFMMECFHGTGMSEACGWFLAFIYKMTGFFQIAALVACNPYVSTVCDILFTVAMGIGMAASFVWSLSFEPNANTKNVKLTQSAMRNEYYKSRNAMAYYGPPAGL